MTPRWLRAVRDFPREHERRSARRVSTGRCYYPPLSWFDRSSAHQRYRSAIWQRGAA